MIISIIIFIFILGILVFAHELGHFLAAKQRGVRVEEFAFGFPPRLFGIRRGETLYSLNLIPVGGFVRLAGETPDGVTIKAKEAELNADDARSFRLKPLWERSVIVLAGVAGNVVLAWLLFSIAHAVGMPSVLEDNERGLGDVSVIITLVEPGSPAESAGLRAGDVISYLRAPDQELQGITVVKEVQSFIAAHRGTEIAIAVERGDKKETVRAQPRTNAPEGQGALGIAMVRTGTRSYPWHTAFLQGAITAWQSTILIIKGMGRLLLALVTEGRLIADVAGPVGIAVLSREAALLGFSYMVFFTAILSLNLAVINSLPLPALDGGRFLFLIIEWLKGSPVSRRAEQTAHAAGFAFLVMLLVLVTYRDVLKLL
jgi:regulator of sigma E protease